MLKVTIDYFWVLMLCYTIYSIVSFRIIILGKFYELCSSILQTNFSI